MSRGAWFALGLAVGVNLMVAVRGVVDYLDATAQQYHRAPGSPDVVRIHPGRKHA